MNVLGTQHFHLHPPILATTMGMARTMVVMGLVVCLLGSSAIQSATCEPSVDLGSVDAIVDGTFSKLVEDAVIDFSIPTGRLEDCGPGGAYQPGRCRRYLKNEPDEAKELFPFLLKDGEAMHLWRDHFRRHVKEVIGNALKLQGGEMPLHASGLKALAEEQFWSSRPAVSKGALAHLRLKMERLKLDAASRGFDATRAVTWEAEVPERFKYHSVKDATTLMGTYLTKYSNPDKRQVPMGDPLPAKVRSNMKPVERENFDAREAFPDCKDVIGHVRDQGECGSCWAFASTETLNDRYCIKSGGKHQEMLSPQHTTSCCDLLHCLSFGCNGGQPRMAWRWFSNDGVVTGGDYSESHDGKSCWPYEVPFCQHHSSGPYPECSGPISKTPKCRKDCEEEEYTTHVRPFKEDLHFAVKSFSVTGRDQIKQELMEGGPLSGAFLVFEDFLLYKKGVYHHVSGMPMGGHAIKVIGFGKEEGKDYWLAVNSWNEYWGDKGTFKIQMGEAGIDDEFCGGEPKVPKEGIFLQQAAQDL